MASKQALLIIDMQNDFCEGGSLAIDGGRSIIEPINKLINSRHWDVIVASKDWHPANHVSFASNHAGRHEFDQYHLQSQDSKSQYISTLWPDHCVQNTHGAAIVDGLDTSKFDAVITKGENPNAEFYSAFQDVFGHSKTNLLSILREHNITSVVVVGLAFDFCVMHTALDAVHFGFHTSIDMSCTKSISGNGMQEARGILQEAGVTLVK